MIRASIKSVLNEDFSYLQDEFARLVEAYRKKEGLSQIDICNLVGEGIDESKLSKLIKRNNGSYGLPLKGHYLMLFIQRGILSVKNLGVKGKTEEEKLLLELSSVLEDDELVFIIFEAKKMGKDPKPVLRQWFNDIKASGKSKDE